VLSRETVLNPIGRVDTNEDQEDVLVMQTVEQLQYKQEEQLVSNSCFATLASDRETRGSV